MTKPLDFSYPDPDGWLHVVRRYLARKQHARLSVVAKEALGIDGMRHADWWRLVGIMLALGWRCRVVDGALIWGPEQPRGWPPASQ
jgi:hypothetical protein